MSDKKSGTWLRIWIVCFVPGILLGCIVSGTLLQPVIAQLAGAKESFFYLYGQQDPRESAYLLYLCRSRLLPLGMVLTVGALGWRRQISVLWSVWLGFSLGVYLSVMGAASGLTGVFAGIMLLFPQWLLYGSGYLLYFYKSFAEKSKTQSFPVKKPADLRVEICCILIHITGMLLEYYVNSEMIKNILKNF